MERIFYEMVYLTQDEAVLSQDNYIYLHSNSNLEVNPWIKEFWNFFKECSLKVVPTRGQVEIIHHYISNNFTPHYTKRLWLWLYCLKILAYNKTLDLFVLQISREGQYSYWLQQLQSSKWCTFASFILHWLQGWKSLRMVAFSANFLFECVHYAMCRLVGNHGSYNLYKGKKQK